MVVLDRNAIEASCGWIAHQVDHALITEANQIVRFGQVNNYLAQLFEEDLTPCN